MQFPIWNEVLHQGLKQIFLVAKFKVLFIKATARKDRLVYQCIDFFQTYSNTVSLSCQL